MSNKDGRPGNPQQMQLGGPPLKGVLDRYVALIGDARAQQHRLKLRVGVFHAQNQVQRQRCR